MTRRSLSALLWGAIDYAGLFPPAALDMTTSVENYARYLAGPHLGMLGRFVVPVSRLDEFLDAADRFVREAAGPWRLSALVGEEREGDIARVAAFNQTNDGALIDAVELRASSPGEVRSLAAALPGGVRAFVEVPLAEDPVELVEAIAAARLRAKARTGGVTPEMIPSPEDLARFLRRCYGMNVPFKATAGLHHPLRGEYPLTYDAASPRATMHGFLNVFLAAAFCFNGLGAADAPRLLSLDSADEFEFTDDGVAWGEYRVTTNELETIRRRFAISFGSCSFTEPIEGLGQLGLM